MRRYSLLAVGAALLLQTLVPSGFMPGRSSDGWFVVLCPQGLPSEFVRQLERSESHAGHHGGHAGGQDTYASSGECELGSALDQPVDAVLPGGFDGIDFSTQHILLGSTSRVVVRLVGIARSRAPPIS